MDSSTRVLPSEMLSKIFSYLPLRDRKSVRLVSRLWRDCSILQSTTEHEKFVFRNGHLVKDIAEAMLQSNYTRLNLEFQDLPVNSIPIRRMWKLCGGRIVTLKFYNCGLDDRSLSDIIVHCENLTSIVIEATLPERRKSRCEIQWPSPTIFTDLVEDRIRRPKLSTFSMLIDNDTIPTYCSSEICLLFPCIKHFGIGTASEKEKFTYSRSLFYGHALDDQLSLDPRDFVAFMRLESFTFNIPTIGEWMGTYDDGAEQGHGLKYLETMLILYDGNMKNTILKFFKWQRNLEVLRLGLGTPNCDEIKEFFFQILGCCPNLRELHLKTEPHYLLLEPSEVPRFVASISKLKVLSLNFVVSDSVTFHDSPADPVLSNLKSLYWDSSNFNVNHDFSHAFLRRCSSLQHLKLVVCCDTTLQIIFENMLELQTLILNDVDNGTTSGFCGQPEGYSIRRHQKLKKLELHGCYNFHLSEEDVQLPRLEFLFLNASFYEDLSDEARCRLASRLPELKVLVVEGVHGDHDRLVKTVQLCKELKNLYRLSLVGCNNHTHTHGILIEENLEDLFNACPHLSYVADSVSAVIYWLNPSSRKVFRKDLASFKFAGNYVEGLSVTRSYILHIVNISRNLHDFMLSVLP